MNPVSGILAGTNVLTFGLRRFVQPGANPLVPSGPLTNKSTNCGYLSKSQIGAHAKHKHAFLTFAILDCAII